MQRGFEARSTAGGEPRRCGPGARRRDWRRWRSWRSVAGCVLLGTALAPGRVTAQVKDSALRLTIRPRELATGTRTAQAGTFPLPGHSVLYVPPKCVGSRRCPLVVAWPDADPDSVVRYLRRGMDEFGLLLLITNFTFVASDTLDAIMKQVLAQVAVDPDKIAVMPGRLALANPDVFSRAFSYVGEPDVLERPAGPGHRLEVYDDDGVLDENGYFISPMAQLAELRALGYRTKQVLSLRAHGFDDYHGYGPQASFYFLARWLADSWAMPDPARRPQPAVVAEPLPLLTPKVVSQMLTFWKSFLLEPDSVRGELRQQHLREVLVPVGPKGGEPSSIMVDMAALAEQCPSVAAKLNAAGLTARQHDAYRVALLSALYIAAAQDPTRSVLRHPSLAVDAKSVLSRNVAFVLAHPDELLALEQTAIWMTP